MRQRFIAAVLLLLMLILLVSASLAQEATQEATPEVTAEATTPVTAAPESTAQVTPAAGGQTYTVRAGETLFRIARQFNLTTAELAAANGITNLNLIFAGQVLKIPVKGTTPTATAAPAPATPGTPVTPAPTTTPPPGSATYTVAAGDTLFRIAVRFNTNVNALAQANNISNPNQIIAGQRLVIPAPGTTPAGTVSTGSTSGGTIVAQAVPGAEFSRGIEVFIEGQDVNALATQVVQLGVKWVKITVNWRKLEVTEGSPDFTALDAAVDAFNGAGLNVMLTLTGAPDWARPSASAFVKQATDYGPPDDVADFGAFAGSVAARYQGKVQAYEIWSQPNLRRSWIEPTAGTLEAVTMSKIRYIDLLKPAYDAIKAVDPTIKVITGGLAPTGFNDFRNAIDDQVFLSALLDQGVSRMADAIGAQPDGFANPPDSTCCNPAPGVDTHFDKPQLFFLDTLNAYRRIMVQKGAQNMPVWVTRFGWGTSEGNALEQPNPDVNPYLNYTSPAEQASYVPRGFEVGDELGFVGSMFLYNLNGCQVNDGEACYYSLVNSARAARPVFTALQSQAVTLPVVEETEQAAVPETSQVTPAAPDPQATEEADG